MDHPLAINQRFLKSSSPESAALSWLRSLNVICKTAHLWVNAFTSWLTHPQTFAFLLYLYFSCYKISNASSNPPLWNTLITVSAVQPPRDLLYQPQKQQILHLWVLNFLFFFFCNRTVNLFSLASYLQQLESDNFVRLGYVHLHLFYLEVDVPLILCKQRSEQSTSLQLLWGSIFDDCAQYNLINCINSLWASDSVCVASHYNTCFPQAPCPGAVSRHTLPKTFCTEAVF